MKNEIRENIILKQEEEKQQQVKRDKLIAEIRTINKKLVSKYNVFDKSSTSYFLLEVGFGLLEEMSLLDLQAKLTEVKAEKKKIQTMKRAQI